MFKPYRFNNTEEKQFSNLETDLEYIFHAVSFNKYRILKNAHST